MAGTEIDACDVLQPTDSHEKQERSFLSFSGYPALLCSFCSGHTPTTSNTPLLSHLVVVMMRGTMEKGDDQTSQIPISSQPGR